jgi:hypothetical protein
MAARTIGGSKPNNQGQVDMEFMNELLQEPPDNRHRQLAQLASTCMQQMEESDRQTCSGPVVRGATLPNNARERVLITRNAQAFREQYFTAAEQLGFTRQEAQEELQWQLHNLQRRNR